METRSSLRNKLKSGFCTIIDNHIIRWKPLAIEDYFYYNTLSKTDEIVPSVLEDEIFRKCVLDKDYVDNLDNLAFGMVSTIAQNIMEHSGPLSIQHFNDTLDHCRAVSQEPLHHLVTLVVRAFPSYKPEDVYGMPFETFMLRVAQAESLLLMIGVIQEPIKLIDENEPVKKIIKQPPAELRAAWEKQQTVAKAKESKKTKDGVKFDKVDMTPEKSPIFTKDKKHPEYRPLGNLDQERITSEQSVGSEEESAERAKMVKQAQAVYRDLMNKLEFYKKTPQQK